MNREIHETRESGKEWEHSPSKRRKWIILLAAVFMAGGLIRAVAANQELEPSFKGKSLYEWLCHYEAVDRSFPLRGRHFTKVALEEALREPTAAVRQIGTNAIPSLLAWIEHNPPPPTTNRLLPSGTMYGISDQAHLAVLAFDILGKEARSACPALGRLASDPRKEEVAECALEALINTGADAVPELVSILTNTNAPRREKAAEAIGRFDTNGLPAVPVLLRCVSDNDVSVAASAAVALSELPARQDVVLPALTNVLNDQRFMVRWGFVRMLSRHSPRPEVIVPALSHALRDPSPSIRWQAIIVISELRPRPESVLPILTNAVSDPNPDVRALVIGTLSIVSPRPESVQLLITNALNDPNPDVRRAATNAITGRDDTLQSWLDWNASRRLTSTNAFNHHFLRVLTNPSPR